MDNKRVWVVVGLIIVAVAAWFLVSRLNATKVDPVVVEQLQWKLVDQGLDADTQATTTRVFARGVSRPRSMSIIAGRSEAAGL